MSMLNNVLIVFVLLLLIMPILCVAAELWMAKKHSKAALFFPLVIMCLFFWTGYYVLILGVILYAVYFIVQYLDKKKQDGISGEPDEMDRMNIHDL